MVTPLKYIRTTAKTTLRGMATRVITVGRQSRRKRMRMRMAKTAPASRLSRIEFTIM